MKGWHFRVTMQLLALLALVSGSLVTGTFAVVAQPAESRLVVVAEGEPETLLPADGCSMLSSLVTDSVYDRLTVRMPDGAIEGSLAESFERIDDLTWRFHLRDDVTFHNGEPFNADAVVTMVEYYVGPDRTSRCAGDFSTLAYPATKVDDYTVDLISTEPDPVFPTRMLNVYMAAPEWLTTSSEEELATNAVGTGPYKLVEWNKGEHVLLAANEDYWGEPKPTIDEIEILGRPEAAVRAAMVQAGEADIAYVISPELAAEVPQAVQELTTEVVGIRLNSLHPVLSDIRVREAIALSIDTASLMEAFYPGSSTPVNGQMVRPSALGYNDELAPYPYDPERAQQLVEEAGATGTELGLVIRAANFPRVQELGEALAAMISQSGLVVQPVILEAGQWRDQLYAVNEGQTRSDLLLTAASNPLFDSSRVIEAYYGDGQFSQADSEEFEQKIDEAGQLSGEEREAAYQALWAEARDQYWMIPLFGLDFVHGLSARTNWTPRDDGRVYYTEMSLDGVS